MAESAEDELIIKFTIETKDSEKGADKFLEHLQKVKEVIDKVQDKIKEFGKSIADHLKIGDALAPLTNLATLPGLIDLGKDAMETAAKFDVLERKLVALTGSYKKAREMEERAEKDAGSTGLFDVESIVKAEIALSKFGLDSERYLPTIEALSAVSGEGLDTLADAMGRLAGGDSGALADLQKAGITEEDLKKKGIKFEDDKPKSKPAEITNAVQGVVADKFGSVIAQEMNTPEAKAKKLQVTWETAMRRMGQAVQSVLTPAIEGITQGLEDIEKSGQLDRIVQGFASLFSLDGQGIKGVVKGIANFLQSMPGHIQAIIDLFKTWWPLIKLVGIQMAGLWMAGKVVSFITTVASAFKVLFVQEEASDMAVAAFDALTGNFLAIGLGVVAVGTMFASLASMISDATSAIGDFNKTEDEGGDVDLSDDVAGLRKQRKKALADAQDDVEAGRPDDAHRAQADKIEKKIQDVLKAQNKGKDNKPTGTPPAAGTTGGEGGDAADKGGKPGKDAKAGEEKVQNGYLYQIAQNTHEMAGGFSQFAFGGGDVARQGVTPQEIHKISGHHGAGKGGAMQRVVKALEELLDEHHAGAARSAVANGYQPSR